MIDIKALVLAALCLAISSHGASGATQSPLIITPVGSSLEIPATLIRPDGEGPFPALVIMHDCSGVGPRSSGAPARWAAELAPQGYVVLIPDSFTPRGFPDGVCSIPGSQSAPANGFVRATDAYGALAALRALPFVDGKRVGVMGGSHGGWTTLVAMFAPREGDNALAEAKREGFAAAVALYPGCAARYGDWSTAREKGASFGPAVAFNGTYKSIAPLLILIGERDDWTPAEPCRRLAESSRAAGYPVEIKIYPGAHHSFDSDRPVRYDGQRNNASSRSGRGATTGGRSGRVGGCAQAGCRLLLTASEEALTRCESVEVRSVAGGHGPRRLAGGGEEAGAWFQVSAAGLAFPQYSFPRTIP